MANELNKETGASGVVDALAGDEAKLTELSDQLGEELFGGEEGSTAPAPTPAPDEPKDPAAATPTPTPTPSPTPAPAPASAATAEAPKTWSEAAKAEWAKIPPTVQSEILKREEDIYKGIEGYKQNAQVGQIVNKIFEPYMPMMRQYGINPLEQVQGLMQAHYTLATAAPEAKVKMAARLLQEYGVPLDALTAAISGQPAVGGEYVDPEVARLREITEKLSSRLNERDQRDMAAARETLKQKVDKFASDPANIYFDELATDIAKYIRSGMELEEAYQTAVYANPVTRAKEIARLQTEREAKAKEEEQKRVEAAKKASGANVRTRPKAGTVTGAASSGDLDEILAEGLKDIRARH